MTPDEHEAQRRQFWCMAFSAAFGCDETPVVSWSAEKADEALTAFDACFPAPNKSEDEG